MVLVVGAVLLRSRRIAIFAAVMALMALILSLGSRLHFDGHRTTIPLPFALLSRLPLLDSGIAVRYMGLFWLFAALLLVVILDASYCRLLSDGATKHSARALVGASALAVFALFPLVPAWPYPSSTSQVPRWFTSDGRALSVGTGVLVYPFASSSDASAMVWQASANLAFKMPGGYAVFAGRSGKATFASSASVLQEALALCYQGRILPLQESVVRSELRSLGVSHVVVSVSAPGATCATRLFARSLGIPRGR